MGSISNASSLRRNVSLRTMYQAYLFSPYSFKINFFVYSSQLINTYFVKHKYFASRYKQGIDGFNFSFFNFNKFCFSVRVFDRPKFFPGFFWKLTFKPRRPRYFKGFSFSDSFGFFFKYVDKFSGIDRRMNFKPFNFIDRTKQAMRVRFNNRDGCIRSTRSTFLHFKFQFSRLKIIFKNNFEYGYTSNRSGGYFMSRLLRTNKNFLIGITLRSSSPFFKTIRVVNRFFYIFKLLFQFKCEKFGKRKKFSKFNKYYSKFKNFFVKKTLKLIQRFVTYIVFNTPGVFFTNKYLVGKFIFKLTIIARLMSKQVKFSFKRQFQRLIYNLSNFQFDFYKSFIRMKFWKIQFVGKLISSFMMLFPFNSVKFDVINNSRMFVPTYLGGITRGSVRQKSKKKARGIVYSAFNKVNRFLFPRIRSRTSKLLARRKRVIKKFLYFFVNS